MAHYSSQLNLLWRWG